MLVFVAASVVAGSLPNPLGPGLGAGVGWMILEILVVAGLTFGVLFRLTARRP